MTTTAEPQRQAPPQQQQPPAEQPPSPRRKQIIVAITVIAIVASLIWGVKTFLYSRAHESTDDAELAANTVPLLSRVQGFVEQLRFDENQHVNQGDTIVTIEASTYRHDLTQAQADLAAAEAAVGSRSLI